MGRLAADRDAGATRRARAPTTDAPAPRARLVPEPPAAPALRASSAPRAKSPPGRKPKRAPAKAARVKAIPPLVGVDEAGRGPVFGPLVVAGVAVEHTRKLKALGVADSKTLAPAKREALAPRIRDAARVSVRVVTVDDLNARMANESLNAIEADVFADILAELGPGTAYLDACDVKPDRFGLEVGNRCVGRAPHLGCVGDFGLKPAFGVVSEHGADKRWPVVAAASIIAKVERDAAIATLAAEFGNVGSGYSHDPRTRAFLAAWHAEHKRIPPFARKFWGTSRAYDPAYRPLTDYVAE